MRKYKTTFILIILLVLGQANLIQVLTEQKQVEQSSNIPQQQQPDPSQNEEQSKSTESGDTAPKEEEETEVIDEVTLRKIIQQEIKPLQEDIQNQTKHVNEKLQKMEDQFSAEMNKTVQNFTKTADKMAKHISKKMKELEKDVNINIQQSSRITMIMYQEQLQQKGEEIEEIKRQIHELEQQLPVLEDSCENYFSCKECLQQGKGICGWCEMEKQCVKGDPNGPLFVSCNFYEFDSCRGNQCIRFTDCPSCLSNPECGWCDDEIQQNSGCFEMNPQFDGCSRKNWYHMYGENQMCSPSSDQQRKIQTEPDERNQKLESLDKSLQTQDERNELSERTPGQRNQILKSKQENLRKLKAQLENAEIVRKQIEQQIEQLRLEMEEFEDKKVTEGKYRLKFEPTIPTDGEDGEYKEDQMNVRNNISAEIEEEEEQLFSELIQKHKKLASKQTHLSPRSRPQISVI